MRPLEDAHVRLDRAEAATERLRRDIQTWGVAHADAYRVGFEHDGKGHVRLFAAIDEQPPREWGLTIGDVITDLRSALDYAVYALAVAQTGRDPPPSERVAEFPITSTIAWFQGKGVQGKIADLDAPTRAYIESVQPYHRGKGRLALTDPLWVLNELAVMYKHRLITPVWVVADEDTLDIKVHGAAVVESRLRKMSRPLEDGSPLAELLLLAKPQAEVDIDATIKAQVAFDEAPGAPPPRADERLRWLAAAVGDVLSRLESFA